MSEEPLDAQSSQIQFVTGFWPVNGNTKHPLSFYSQMFPKTLSFLGCDRPKLIVPNFQVAIHLGAVELGYKQDDLLLADARCLVPSELKKRVAENTLRNSSRSPAFASMRPKGDKHRNHFLNHLSQMGVVPYSNLVITWLAKIYAIRYFLESCDAHESRFLGWVDAGIARIWRAPLRSTLSDSTLWPLSEDGISHTPARMKKGQQKLLVSAGILVAKPRTWRRLFSIFENRALDAFTEPYLHDEETVLSRVAQEKIFTFKPIGDWDRHY